MSVQSEIDRINGEVNSQSTIIDQISSVLDSKSPSNMLSSGAIVTNSVSTPLQNNTTKLQALKEKADSLPEYVPPTKLQEKTVTPTKEGLSVVPDSGFDGMSKVTVNGDINLVSENIKEGVSVFGVEGNLKGTKINEINLDWIMNDDGKLEYTDIEGERQGISLESVSYENRYTNIDIDKDIIINTSTRITSGYEITISISNGILSIDFYDKGFGPTA